MAIGSVMKTKDKLNGMNLSIYKFKDSSIKDFILKWKEGCSTMYYVMINCGSWNEDEPQMNKIAKKLVDTQTRNDIWMVGLCLNIVRKAWKMILIEKLAGIRSSHWDLFNYVSSNWDFIDYLSPFYHIFLIKLF